MVAFLKRKAVHAMQAGTATTKRLYQVCAVYPLIRGKKKHVSFPFLCFRLVDKTKQVYLSPLDANVGGLLCLPATIIQQGPCSPSLNVAGFINKESVNERRSVNYEGEVV